MEKEELLLKQKTISDIVLIGYMMFLNEKGLLEEANQFVAGFLSVLTPQEKEELLKKATQSLEQAVAHDTNKSA